MRRDSDYQPMGGGEGWRGSGAGGGGVGGSADVNKKLKQEVQNMQKRSGDSSENERSWAPCLTSSCSSHPWFQSPVI
eukprot:1143356-Pelagomonas_calceolata.AAC.1